MHPRDTFPVEKYRRMVMRSPSALAAPCSCERALLGVGRVQGGRREGTVSEEQAGRVRALGSVRQGQTVRANPLSSKSQLKRDLRHTPSAGPEYTQPAPVCPRILSFKENAMNER